LQVLKGDSKNDLLPVLKIGAVSREGKILVPQKIINFYRAIKISNKFSYIDLYLPYLKILSGIKT